MSSFQELLEQKQKEADRQKQIRDKQAKIEAERAEKEKAERIKREHAEEERAKQLRAAARRKEQDDAEKARKAALAKEKLERERLERKPSVLAKTSSRTSSSSKPKPSSSRTKSVSSHTTSGTKAPILTREEKRKLKEDREFGVAAPNATVSSKKMSEGDRVARMLAAATAGRGLNAKIPERTHVRRPETNGMDSRGADGSVSRTGSSVSAGATANRTGPTYKAHSSIAHQVTPKPVKPLERVQERARELATSNVGKDRRSIDQVQREIRGSRAVEDDRGFFDGPRRGDGKAKSSGSGSSSTPRKKQVDQRITGDSSYVINKMGLLADERVQGSRSTRPERPSNGHDSAKASSSSVPSKRRRRSITPSDASDASEQDFDSDDLDDVDVRRKKTKKQASTIGSSTRRREASPPLRQKKRPLAGGSVLAAAGLDIYAMFGRKDREFYLSRDRASDSEDDMEADAATIRKEEARAARQAREDDRREEAEERRRAEEKRRRKEKERR